MFPSVLLSEIQVKIVAVTGIWLDASRVEFVTNVPTTKTRGQPVIRVVMSNGPLTAELHGTFHAHRYSVTFFHLTCHVFIVLISYEYICKRANMFKP